VDEAAEGQRLDNFLLRHLKGVPKTHVYRLIRSGEVRVNKGRAQADTRLSLGDTVRLPPVRTAAPTLDPADASAVPPREFPVLFEDEHLLVIDKPAGVAVHGGSGVSFGVIEQLRRARPQAKFLELVHRIDKETSGLLMVAKRRSALTALQDQLRSTGGVKAVDKRYAALVWGAWPAAHRVIDVPPCAGGLGRAPRRPAGDFPREGGAQLARPRGRPPRLQPAGSGHPHRPHPPDSGAPEPRRAPDRGRPQIRGFRPQPGHRPRPVALWPHVPARAAPGISSPCQR
jgi:RNA pseudouridylate synthase/S4 domain